MTGLGCADLHVNMPTLGVLVCHDHQRVSQRLHDLQYGLVHIAVGDLLREEVKNGTAAGTRAKSFMDAGNLVPDEVVVEMVVNRLNEDDVKGSGWLLDGYPRYDPH